MAGTRGQTGPEGGHGQKKREEQRGVGEGGRACQALWEEEGCSGGAEDIEGPGRAGLWLLFRPVSEWGQTRALKPEGVPVLFSWGRSLGHHQTEALEQLLEAAGPGLEQAELCGSGKPGGDARAVGGEAGGAGRDLGGGEGGEGAARRCLHSPSCIWSKAPSL